MMLDALFASHGYTIDAGSGASAAGSLSGRKSLDDAGLWAPDHNIVLAALASWKNDAENLPTHDDFVAALAAIKASLGPTRDQWFGDVLEWALGYEGNDVEYVQKVWDSITDSSLGWEWLASNARPHGFSDAETDFADPPPAEYLPAPPRKLALIREDEMHGLARAHDFVEGLLCDGQLSVVYGDANVGKSFFMLDLAYHVALGWKWRGLDVDQGAAVYIAGEGAGGLVARIAAFRAAKELTGGAPLYVLPEAVNLREPKEVARLIEHVRDIKPRLIIVDTLSRALAGGNENAPDDMGALVKGVDKLRAATGAHVSLIHHSGKDDARGARGHSLLRAAIDTEIKVAIPEGATDTIAAVPTKQRDLEYGPPFAFKLRTVKLGMNGRGKPITSCVVEAAPPPRPELKDAEEEAADILQQLIFDGDKAEVHADDWRKAALGEAPDGTARKNWKRIRDRLIKLKVIELRGDMVSIKRWAPD